MGADVEYILSFQYTGTKGASILPDPSAFQFVLFTLREDLTFLGLPHPKAANVRVLHTGNVSFSWVTQPHTVLHRNLVQKKQNATASDLHKLSIAVFNMREQYPPSVSSVSPSKKPFQYKANQSSSETSISVLAAARQRSHPYTKVNGSSGSGPSRAQSLAEEAQDFLNDMSKTMSTVPVKPEPVDSSVPSATAPSSSSFLPSDSHPGPSSESNHQPRRMQGETELEFETRMFHHDEMAQKTRDSNALSEMVRQQQRQREENIEEQARAKEARLAQLAAPLDYARKRSRTHQYETTRNRDDDMDSIASSVPSRGRNGMDREEGQVTSDDLGAQNGRNGTVDASHTRSSSQSSTSFRPMPPPAHAEPLNGKSKARIQELTHELRSLRDSVQRGLAREAVILQDLQNLHAENGIDIDIPEPSHRSEANLFCMSSTHPLSS
ncbi:hypothetical protein C8J56DRAFT_920351 [Mycena floridula]|nr:hypothetical protein C8J56DRAFT_920351 [Mycena floridula]